MRTNFTVPAAAVELLALAIIVFLIRLEHMRAIRGSDKVAIYLLVTLSLDVVQVSSLYIRSAPMLASVVIYGFQEVIQLLYQGLYYWQVPKRTSKGSPFNWDVGRFLFVFRHVLGSSYRAAWSRCFGFCFTSQR